METKTIKKYLSLFAFIFLMVPSVVPAQAQLSDMSPEEAATRGMDSLIGNLGIDKAEMKNTMRTLNVSRQKKIAPQVSLIFTPADPQAGDKLTVTAIPSYFMNDPSKLYFTWFLKQKDCGKTDEPNSAERKKCDLNDDGRIDIEDYKIKAMRTIANNDFVWENADYAHSDGKSAYDATMGGDDQKGKNAYCYIQDIRSGNNYRIENCDKHLFPDAPHEETGDNSFGRSEEQFWHTDPTSADTFQSGNTDEANVSGLGMSKFTWNYTLGDKVGVVIEGVSVEPTQMKDSSYQTMWAAPKGLCYNRTINDGTFSEVSDLNDCLYDSLITPSENSPESNKIDVTLSFSPASPINDRAIYSNPLLSNGDEVVIQSGISNANDNNYLQYSWEVFSSDDPNPDSWGNPLPKSSLPNATQMEGLGISSFKFKLNLNNPKKYLKVKLTVKENTENDAFREGHNSILIPITSNDDIINAFSTSVSDQDSPYISMVDKICDSGVENAICPITKDAIIGLKVSSNSLTDFLWTINGKPFTYQECFFDGCDINKQSRVAYFPALKEIGEKYTINLTALNKNTGEKVNLSRVFQVIDPEITISSADKSTCEPVLLGNYIDINGTAWPDYSKSNFWGLADNQIKLQANVKGFPLIPTEITWIVDGVGVVASNAAALGYELSNGVITLPAKPYGESYEISATTMYAQDNITKAALNKYWNVSYDQFYEKGLSSSVTIQLQDSTSTVASASTKKILATIYSGTPAYLAFLLKIALTAFLILFSSQLVLSFFPKNK